MDEKKLIKLLKNKKVALVTEYYYTDLGGAEKSIKNFVKKLKNIDVYTFESNLSKKNNFKVKENLFRFYKIHKISKIIQKLDLSKYDYILTQSLIAPFVVNKYPKISIYFIRDELNLNEFKNYETGIRRTLKTIKDKLEHIFINNYKKANKKALQSAKLIVANSKFMQKKVARLFNRKSLVVYPEINKIKMLKRQPKYITFIGYGNHLKGSFIAKRIAENYFQEKFLFIGKGIREKKVSKNITYLPWGQKMDEVYAKSKLIIVPSVCEEAYGRIVAEACNLKIPVICSNKGGLPEANKNSKNIVKDIYNTNIWIKKIKENLK